MTPDDQLEAYREALPRLRALKETAESGISGFAVASLKCIGIAFLLELAVRAGIPCADYADKVAKLGAISGVVCLVTSFFCWLDAARLKTEIKGAEDLLQEHDNT